VHATRVTATSGFAFDPSTVSIPANDSVFFTFQGVQHNVVFDTQGSPANVGNTTSATVKRQFPTAGTYNYHCGIHPSMTGSVTVTP
jgi:plastocyanin